MQSQKKNNILITCIINNDAYNKLSKFLTNDKVCKYMISEMTPKYPPKMFYNIALIALPDDDENIENFKILFQEKCNGKLYVYRLKNNSLQSALEYFKKYHNIDLICLLTNKLNLKNIYELSSRTNVKYMINRKNVPYIISIISSHIKTIPLTMTLSNKVININECII